MNHWKMLQIAFLVLLCSMASCQNDWEYDDSFQWGEAGVKTTPDPDPAPVLNSLSPDTGLPAGGTTITLVGSDFQEGATVTVGGNPCTNYNYLAVPDQLTCDTPAGALGTVDVEVTNPDDQSSTLPNSFTYYMPGALDLGFGTGGLVTSNPSAGIEAVRSICADASYIYIAGYDDTAGDRGWRIEKRSKTDGALVTSFGAGGVVTVNPSMMADEPWDMVIDSTHLYVAGFDKGPGTAQWRIEKRLLSDGSLESMFGVGGIITSDLSASDYAYALAVDPSYLYVAGFDSIPGDQQWRIEKRDLTTGSLVTAFGMNGVVVSNPSPGSDTPSAMAIDSTHMYVAGYDSASGNGQWRIEKRSLLDGSLHASFGTAGVVLSNPSPTWEMADAIAIDATSLYVFGRDDSPGDFQWRVEKRLLADGSLDMSFGSFGVLTTDPTTSYDTCSSILIDSTSIYLVGAENSGFSQAWRVEKRSASSGALDNAFGTFGVLVSDHGTGQDIAQAAVLDATHLYIAGMGTLPGDEEWVIEKRCK